MDVSLPLTWLLLAAALSLAVGDQLLVGPGALTCLAVQQFRWPPQVGSNPWQWLSSLQELLLLLVPKPWRHFSGWVAW